MKAPRTVRQSHGPSVKTPRTVRNQLRNIQRQIGLIRTVRLAAKDHLSASQTVQGEARTVHE